VGFIRTLKEIKWDLSGRRFLYKQALLTWIPSYIGLRLRYRFYKKYLKSLGEETDFHENVNIRNPHKLSIGSRCAMGLDMKIQAGGGMIVGNNVLFGPGVCVWTSNHVFTDPDKLVREQGLEYKEVIVGDDVWIGANAFIMPGAHLPRGCIVSAGAVVGGKKYKEYSILAGNPARVIGFRNAGKESPRAETGENSPGSATIDREKG